MAKKEIPDESFFRSLARRPEFSPVVPDHAERMQALPHFRAQYHPLFLNAHDMPDHQGPRQYLGLDYRCPICKHIQSAGPPGQENTCEKCDMHYKYTALKGDCWLWIWKPRETLVLSETPKEKLE